MERLIRVGKLNPYCAADPVKVLRLRTLRIVSPRPTNIVLGGSLEYETRRGCIFVGSKWPQAGGKPPDPPYPAGLFFPGRCVIASTDCGVGTVVGTVVSPTQAL